MKEYMVQMKLGNGKWVRGRRPNIISGKNYKSIEGAREFMDSCVKGWDRYVEKNHKHLLKETLPVEWRIMSREVSEWAAE